VVFGAASEHADGQALIGRLPGLEVIDLIGRVELPVVAAIVRRAALYVGNDSGLMHLAAASGAPTLGLFGPSDERRYAPWGRRAACVRTPQSPRELIDFPGYDHRSVGTLMDTLTVDAVLEAANALLRDSRGRAA
jgi:ADP-heptose:LPS heptosyltransferase